MTTVFRGPCAPSQGLANAVLLSSEQLLRLSKSDAIPQVHAGKLPVPSINVRSTPPPLPARPTPPVPLKQPENDTNAGGPSLIDLTEPSRSSSPTLMGDAASDRSFGQTNAEADAMEISGSASDSDVVIVPATSKDTATQVKDDVEMTDGETIVADEDGEKGSSGVTAADEDTPTSNTEGLLRTLKIKHELTMIQQDVDEIMGRVLGLLQASIQPTSIEGDIQIEVVMQTFFFKVIMHTVNLQNGDPTSRQDTRTAEFFRNLTAYPAPDGPCTLYQALDNNFDREEIEGTTTSRYSSIESLPPILHVLVQRTKGDGTKNPNPVVIDEYLQLDRYMDAPAGSDLMYLRETSWALKKQKLGLIELEDQLSMIANIPQPISRDGAFGADTAMWVEDQRSAIESADSAFQQYAEATLAVDFSEDSADQRGMELLSFLGSGDVNVKQTQPQAETQTETGTGTGTPTPQSSDPRDYLGETRDKLQQELSLVHAKQEGLFEGMNNYNYALHAVVCHSGSGRGGHYWVWIRDFEAKLWRKYNDTVVSEEKDTRKLLDTLNSSGDPYFLCYVRDVDKELYVSVPKRKPDGFD